MIVGEGPGGVEDDYGCPLIGPSGQLLDRALWSVRITRDRVYTTNVIKCRPKGNRTPTVEEGAFCAQKWLEQEIRLLQPKVILALGSVALRYFKGPDAGSPGNGANGSPPPKGSPAWPLSIPPICSGSPASPRLPPNGKSSTTWKPSKPKWRNSAPGTAGTAALRSICLSCSGKGAEKAAVLRQPFLC